MITGWVYQEPDLVPAATSQFLETIRGLQCQADMVLAPRFYAAPAPDRTANCTGDSRISILIFCRSDFKVRVLRMFDLNMSPN